MSTQTNVELLETAYELLPDELVDELWEADPDELYQAVLNAKRLEHLVNDD